jgi:hypothetical protein
MAENELRKIIDSTLDGWHHISNTASGSTVGGILW